MTPRAPLPFAVLASLAVPALSACVEPTNRCDPDAAPDVQAQGTRISGAVLDQDGEPVPGVPVGLLGRQQTVVSGEGGVFTFSDVPPAASYEVVASPAAPLVGGRAATGALVCGGVLEDVVVRVVVPPDSPEVEIVRASGDRRLFAAFGAVDGAAEAGDVARFFEDETSFRPALDVAAQCAGLASSSTISYRAQLRAPFEAWQDAVLAPSPWVDAPGDGVPDEAYVDRIDDVCAAAACAQFSYLEPALANERARCVDIVGVKVGGAIVGLEPFGTYQVRVLAELRTPDELKEEFALPERVTAEAPTVPGQMTLIPGALLPVVGTDGLPRDVGDVTGLVTTAGGRFALVEGDALSVIGDGADTLDDVAQDAVGSGFGDAVSAPQGAFGEDAAATESMTADFTAGAAVPARPVALLPAGDWVRVIRRLDDGTASIEKVYVGSTSAEAQAGAPSDEALANAEQPSLRLDPISESAGDGLRAFTYLAPDASPLVDEGINPRDAYVLLYGSAFVLVEQGRPDDLMLEYFATQADPTTGDLVPTTWADGADGSRNSGAGGACAAMQQDGDKPSSMESLDGVVPRVNVSVCYDVGVGLGDDVDLRDVEVLPDLFGLGTRRHLISDAANDRLLVAEEAAVACAGCDPTTAPPLSQQIVDVRVGREPLALLATRVLDCSGEGLPGRPVLLVANHGSGDLSVVEDVNGAVEETGVVALPTAPVGFLDDPIGATCADPFIWVLGDDGRVVPVDMRGEPSVPLCNGRACDVGTRGRGAVGAVARSLLKPSRSLVGGNDLLGELGFFKPRALRGAAYADSGAIVGEAEAVPPSP